MKQNLLSVRTLFFIVLLGLSLPSAWGQDDELKNWSLSGYIKNLEALYFLNEPIFPGTEETFFQDNLIHNRLNFTAYLSEAITFRADLRSRIFYGELVKLQPNYGDLINDANNDYLDLSLVLLDEEAWVIHTMLDRLYFEYLKNNLEIRLGRQRVNWGINMVWNPNDVFNAYSFTDFDYEERPGSDALRVKYYTGFASSIEIVSKVFDDWDEATIGALWKLNKWKYDFQILAAFVENDLALGGGWAGNIKTASFKGEFTWFHATKPGQKDNFAATFGVDYSFSNSFYINGGFLYNHLGSSSANVANLFSFELSARNLYPYKYAIFGQWTYPFTPLINGGMAVIYSPVDVHPLFVNPTVTLSIKENWDIDFIGQIVFNKTDKYTSPLQVAFLRLKFSY